MGIWQRLRHLPEWVLFLLVALLAAGAVWPLLRPGYLAGRDAFVHLFRLYELDLMLRQGVLFPRWLPDLFYGYGYPLFHFNYFLLYYAAEPLLRVGLGYIGAIQGTMALATILAGWGAYRFAGELYGSRAAGVVSALATVYLPYHLVNLYQRSALGEAFGYALLPWLLWAVRRALLTSQLRYLLWGGILGAGLILSHNPSALLFFPVLGGYGLWLILAGPNPQPWSFAQLWMRPLASLVLLFLLALGLSAFFWLPALVEVQYTALEATGSREQFLRELEAGAPPVQMALAYDHGVHEGRPHQAGAVQLLLALGGGVALLWRRAPGHREAWYFFALLVGCFVLLLPLSRPFWEQVPFLALMSFPWRLQLLVGVATALLIGALAAVGPARLRVLGMALAGAALVLASLATLQPAKVAVGEESVSRAWYARYEVGGPYLGTTSPPQFLPRWVAVDPFLLRQPRASAVASAPEPTPLVELEHAGATSLSLRVRSDAPSSLTLHQAYFPGWEARLDEGPLAVQPWGERGLVQVNLPPGEHRLHLRFSGTPLARLAEGLSAATAILLLLGLLFAGLRRGPWGLSRVAGRQAAVLWWSLAILVVIPAAVGVVGGGSGAEQPLHPAQVTFGQELRLLGWRVNTEAVARTGTLGVDLLWHSLRDQREELVDTLELRDSSGKGWAITERGPFFGAAPTSWWRRGELVRDAQVITLPPDIPPGEYRLELGVRRAQGTWLPVAGEERTTLGPIQIATSPSLPRVPSPEQALGVSFGGEVELLGYTLRGGQGPPQADQGAQPLRVRAGETLEVELLWRALKDLAEDYAVSVQLWDGQQVLHAQQDSYPAGDLRLTSAWGRGRPVPDAYALPIPRGLASGRYTVVVKMYRQQDQRPLAAVGPPGADAPSWVVLEPVKVVGQGSALPPAQGVEAVFGGVIVLEGYTLERRRFSPGNRIDLTLQWRAQQAPRADYQVFVHLVDAQGKILAQADGPPARGNYPTSWWEPQERITDARSLALPQDLAPGSYGLRVGLYLLSSGERLPVPGAGTDGVSLGTISVEG